jgi:NAD(P)-dependent dehydrogenase (short-subunit alcohol dehydrogenase family)
VSQGWTTNDIPDQHGKTIIVTGANSGIGFEAALALAAKGAQVILAVRSAEKGQTAVTAIRQVYPQATVEVMELDLSDLASVRRFAQAFLARFNQLPVLINNAGVMALPFRKTVDGFEMQFGTNHLGHFALTGLLLPAIITTPGARVVNVSSGVHVAGSINFENLNGEKGYERWSAYAQSKLANLLFTYELQRRFAAAGVHAISVGCHPGYAATNLQSAGAKMEGSSLGAQITEFMNQIFAQSAAMGALPTLYAATNPDVNGCDYIGPRDLFGWRGAPVKMRSSARSYDAATAARLWQVSEEFTGVRYEQLAVGVAS